LVGQWLSPVLLTVSLVLLGRSFYALYVQRRGTRASKVIAWLSAASVAGFWMLRLIR
jgi:hypothetical protein